MEIKLNQNYISVFLKYRNDILVHAESLGIRELVKFNSNNSQWLMASNAISYGERLKKADNYIYAEHTYFDKWDNTKYTLIVKHYPTNKKLELTKPQLVRYQKELDKRLKEDTSFILEELYKAIAYKKEQEQALVNFDLKKVIGKELLILADLFELKVPARTRSTINKLKIVEFTIDEETNRVQSCGFRGSFSKSYNGDSLWDLINKIISCKQDKEDHDNMTAEDHAVIDRLFAKG